jgi:hypothetical protein
MTLPQFKAHLLASVGADEASLAGIARRLAEAVEIGVIESLGDNGQDLSLVDR